MRVCDICGQRAVEEIRFKSDDHSQDICAGHRQIILEFLTNPWSKSGRTPGSTKRKEETNDRD